MGYGEDIPYMVKADFDQNYPFNKFCPDLDAAGCGPVAIAEILSYYKSPPKGRGSVSYENPKNPGQLITADLDNMPFDWDNILNQYNANEYTGLQADAVANLIYACGAAMRVAYGPSTSTQNKNQLVYCLQHNLCMSPDSRYLNRQYYSTSDWIEILNKQLRLGYPVFYRGSKIYDGSESGHMFVIDGMNEKGLYHANWGHGGYGNKYTDLDILNQGNANALPGGRWTCYNFKQAMMINCYPTPEIEKYPLQWCDLYEPIRINDDDNINEITIVSDQTFSLNTRVVNCSEEAMSVNCKFFLMKDGKEISRLSDVRFCNFRPYYIGKINTDIRLPKALPDGEYEIILFSKSDAEPDWKPVYDNPVNKIMVTIDNDRAKIYSPSCHAGNPCLYFPEPIEVERVDTGIELKCIFANPTINNFSDIVRFSITTDKGIFQHEALVCVYSQTESRYGILISDSQLSLSQANIISISAAYRYGNDEAYFHIGDSNISAILYPEATDIAKDIHVYDITGKLMGCIKATEIASGLQPFISSLPHGIYILVEGKKTRKIIR